MKVLSEKIYRANKEHKCSCCHKTILMGDLYRSQFNVDSGESHTFKTCNQCSWVADNHFDWLSGNDNIILDGAFADRDFSKEDVFEIIEKSKNYLENKLSNLYLKGE